MNNYKFRGKIVGQKKWAYGFFLEDRKITECKIRYYIRVKDIDDYYFHCEVLPKTVGQWTGLKDKNGKEIYEGDIVEITQGEATCKREVIFITAMFALRRDDMAIWICNVLPKDMEVVGNIHDNPELLGGK